MAGGKYAKYVIEGLTPWDVSIPQHEGKMLNLFLWSKDWFADSKIWVELDLAYAPGGTHGGGAEVLATSGEKKGEVIMTLGVHHHPIDEAFFYFGTNPQKPLELCGEYEFWLGAGEDAEQFIFTKNTCIYVPGNLAHNPNRATRVDNPAQPIVMLVILVHPHHGPGTTDYPTDAAGNRLYPPGWVVEAR